MSAPGADLELVVFAPHYKPFRKTPINSADETSVTASGQTPIGNALALHGWSLLEPTGTTAALIILYDGPITMGQSFAPIALSAGQSTRDYFGNNGIVCTTGRIFLDIVSGAVQGVLYWRDEH